MAQRFRSLRKIFNNLIDRGLPDADVRVLDHGVCGGLLQLAASTYYYRLHASARLTSNARSNLAKKILRDDWSPAFWWTGIVWGTAATGLHNIQQISAAAKLDVDWPRKLQFADDPLAYLGILVDIIQEWNRYSVFKKLAGEPIQGIEVELGTKAGKVVLRFKEPDAVKRAKKVRKELNQSLVAWSDLLEVQPQNKSLGREVPQGCSQFTKGCSNKVALHESVVRTFLTSHSVRPESVMRNKHVRQCLWIDKVRPLIDRAFSLAVEYAENNNPSNSPLKDDNVGQSLTVHSSVPSTMPEWPRCEKRPSRSVLRENA